MEGGLSYFWSHWIMLDPQFPKMYLCGAAWSEFFFSAISMASLTCGSLATGFFSGFLYYLQLLETTFISVAPLNCWVHTGKLSFSLESRKYRAELFIHGPFCPACQDLHLCHLTVIYSVLQALRENPVRGAHKDNLDLWDNSCPVSHMEHLLGPSVWYCSKKIDSRLYICVDVQSCWCTEICRLESF